MSLRGTRANVEQQLHNISEDWQSCDMLSFWKYDSLSLQVREFCFSFKIGKHIAIVYYWFTIVTNQSGTQVSWYNQIGTEAYCPVPILLSCNVTAVFGVFHYVFHVICCTISETSVYIFHCAVYYVYEHNENKVGFNWIEQQQSAPHLLLLQLLIGILLSMHET